MKGPALLPARPSRRLGARAVQPATQQREVRRGRTVSWRREPVALGTAQSRAKCDMNQLSRSQSPDPPAVSVPQCGLYILHMLDVGFARAVERKEGTRAAAGWYGHARWTHVAPRGRKMWTRIEASRFVALLT
eukprot:scaffold4823_cov98-Isochrysis_galbana.AAC.1